MTGQSRCSSPASPDPTRVATRAFLAGLPRADPGLAADLAEQLTETTDDAVDPWQ
jgi:O-phosphoseryl-tRNA(Cys) synthetase